MEIADQLKEITFDPALLISARSKALPEKSASEVALLLGITPATLCDFEKGRAYPSLKTAIKMSFLYSVDLRDLTTASKDSKDFFKKKIR